MIFVTVGSGWNEELVKSVDRIATSFKDEFVAQIGEGKYVPKNIKWFRYVPSLKPYLEKADVVITHPGVGTVFECLHMHKKTVVIPNLHSSKISKGTDELVRKLGKMRYLIFVEDMHNLAFYIQQAKEAGWSD